MKYLGYILALFLMPVLFGCAHTENIDRMDHLCREINYATYDGKYLQKSQELLTLAKSSKNEHYEAIAYSFFAYYCISGFFPEPAKFWQHKLDSICAKTNDYNLPILYDYLVICRLNERGKFGEALTKCIELDLTADKHNSKFSRKIAALGFINTYLSCSQFDFAMDEYLQLYDGRMPKSLENDVDVLLASNISSAFHITGKDNEYKQLTEEIRSYIKLYKAGKGRGFSNKETIPFLYFIMEYTYNYIDALHYFNLGDVETAHKYFIAMENEGDDFGNVFRTTTLHVVKAEISELTGYYEDAISQYNQLIILAKEFGSLNDEMTNTYSKAKAQMKVGRHEEAMKNYQNAIVLSDSLMNSTNYREISVFHAKKNAIGYRMKSNMLSQQRITLSFISGALSTLFIVLVILTITGNRLQKRLRKTMRSLEKSKQFKLIYFANMNHEIRTPLNAISGFSELLTDETDPETRRTYVGIIHDNNQQLVRLINDVLDISKIEADMLSIDYSTFNVRFLMENAYQTVRMNIPEGVRFTLISPVDVEMCADEGRVMQIVINFLTNAIKHTDTGFIRMGFNEEGDQICFFVADSGCGIAKERQEEIFCKFVQETEQKGGVGLGLALCKGFVEKMHGTIGVESELGQGSTFWFKLPKNFNPKKVGGG